MTITSRYNHTMKRLVNKEFNYTTLRVMLLDDTAAFDGTHTTLTEVAGAGNSKEVHGNGWPQGGELLANVAIEAVAFDDATPDDWRAIADNIAITATPGNIGPAYNYVIYDQNDVNDAPLLFADLEGPQEAGATTQFKIDWDPTYGWIHGADDPANLP